MENKDIERSPVVIKILDIYDIDNLRYNMTVRYSNIKNLIKSGAPDVSVNTTVIKSLFFQEMSNFPICLNYSPSFCLHSFKRFAYSLF